MTFKDFLASIDLNIHRLHLMTGIPTTTLQDVGSGKRNLEDCSGKILLKISKSTGATIEELLALEPEECEKEMPPHLKLAIHHYRKHVYKHTMYWDSAYMELNSSINVAEVDNEISHEMAARLRDRYM